MLRAGQTRAVIARSPEPPVWLIPCCVAAFSEAAADWRRGEILTRIAALWDGTGLQWQVLCNPLSASGTCLLSFRAMVS